MKPTALDEEAMALCRRYQDTGEAAYLICTRPNDHFGIIGPQLPASRIAAMLRDAADALDATPDHVLN